MSSRHTVAVFMGTRPEAIKLAPVVAALRARERLSTAAWWPPASTRRCSGRSPRHFGFAVDADLDVMRPNQTLAGLTARLMDGIDGWLEMGQPDMALVQGDTTTVLVASLACFYRRIPIGHVEAGLRTGNIWSPFPEEVNRRLATPLVALHFAPTEAARAALLREGVSGGDHRGDGQHRHRRPAASRWPRSRRAGAARAASTRSSSSLAGRRLGRSAHGPHHRAPPRELRRRHRADLPGHRHPGQADIPDHRFVYPVHLNPNVLVHVNRLLGGLANVRLIAPQGYRNFVALMARCRLVLTDSGGVQEEAPSLGKPVLVMRDTTERPEGVAAGTALLIGPARRRHRRAHGPSAGRPAAYEAMANAVNPYGDGRAAERILARIHRFFGAPERDHKKR